MKSTGNSEPTAHDRRQRERPLAHRGSSRHPPGGARDRGSGSEKATVGRTFRASLVERELSRHQPGGVSTRLRRGGEAGEHQGFRASSPARPSLTLSLWSVKVGDLGIWTMRPLKSPGKAIRAAPKTTTMAQAAARVLGAVIHGGLAGGGRGAAIRAAAGAGAGAGTEAATKGQKVKIPLETELTSAASTIRSESESGPGRFCPDRLASLPAAAAASAAPSPWISPARTTSSPPFAAVPMRPNGCATKPVAPSSLRHGFPRRSRGAHRLRPRAFPRLDLLVNNAGMAPRERRDLLDATEESFDELIDANLKGPHFLTQSAARWMRAIHRPHRIRHFHLRLCRDRESHRILHFQSRPEHVRCPLRRAPGGPGIPVFEVRPGIVRTDMIAKWNRSMTRKSPPVLCPRRAWASPRCGQSRPRHRRWAAGLLHRERTERGWRVSPRTL